MKFYFILLCAFLAGSWCTYSQHTLSGIVTTPQNQPLDGAHIHIEQLHGISNPGGYYEVKDISPGSHRVVISYIGYKTLDTVTSVYSDIVLNAQLTPQDMLLDAVAITQMAKGTPVNKETVNEDYIKREFTGSLASSLSKLPGVNSMDIGAGASKPIIRGLGLNRVAVTENGLKHEGQQWGADHGLEIDALQVEKLEVIKGAGTIEYGSDAIAGIIRIKNDAVPQKNSFSGQGVLFGRSVNNTVASSVTVNQRFDRFFYKLKATASDFGDYNVPTDEINYLTIKMPVYNGRLKNTAGKENSLSAQVGYADDNFESVLSVSSFYNKTGFFPGSHGIPSISRVEDDGDSRNIDYPYQRTQHYKVNSTSKWLFEDADLTFIAGYQNNKRQEWSEFHTHYGGQQPPEINPDLELDFNLTTWDAQLKYSHRFSEKHRASAGIQYQGQENTITGFSFLLPEYTRNAYSVYGLYDFEPTERWTFNAGARLDYANINISRFYDPILYQYLIGRGSSQTEAADYAQRSAGLDKDFSSFNVMLGAYYRPNDNWEYSVNTGTSFRLPIAIELSSNGIHHGSFRHERGNEFLDPEKGLVLDAKAAYTNSGWNVSFSPYLYYFMNYIFLNPTNSFSQLPHAGQVYQYEQTKALLTGAEISITKTFFEKLQTNVAFEYLYNRQINEDASRNYPLPFSPPMNAFAEVGYEFYNSEKIQNVLFSVNTRIASSQDRIAQGEEVTAGYAIFGGGLSSTLSLGRFKTDINLTAHNIFNTKYYNHTSFYRALEIPEMGRNIQLMIRIPFGTNE